MRTKSKIDRQFSRLIHDGQYSGLMSGFVRTGRGWTIFHGRQLQEVNKADLFYTAGWIFGKLELHRRKSRYFRLSPEMARLLRRWHRKLQAEILARKLAES